VELKIRKLVRKDRRILSAMIRKLADKVGDNRLLSIISSDAKAEGPSEDAGGKTIQIGIEIVKMLIDTLESDISAWFADLCGVTVEELDNSEFDIEIKIIEHLKQAPEIADFFSGASRLFNSMKKSKA